MHDCERSDDVWGLALVNTGSERRVFLEDGERGRFFDTKCDLQIVCSCYQPAKHTQERKGTCVPAHKIKHENYPKLMVSHKFKNNKILQDCFTCWN